MFLLSSLSRYIATNTRTSPACRLLVTTCTKQLASRGQQTRYITTTHPTSSNTPEGQFVNHNSEAYVSHPYVIALGTNHLLEKKWISTSPLRREQPQIIPLVQQSLKRFVHFSFFSSLIHATPAPSHLLCPLSLLRTSNLIQNL